MFDFLKNFFNPKPVDMSKKNKGGQNDEPNLSPEEIVSSVENLKVTNEMLKKIQKYFYFRGDRFALKMVEENISFLGASEPDQVSKYLKDSNDALRRVHDNCYGANDFFLDKVIQANDEFLKSLK